MLPVWINFLALIELMFRVIGLLVQFLKAWLSDQLNGLLSMDRVPGTLARRIYQILDMVFPPIFCVCGQDYWIYEGLNPWNFGQSYYEVVVEIDGRRWSAWWKSIDCMACVQKFVKTVKEWGDCPFEKHFNEERIIMNFHLPLHLCKNLDRFWSERLLGVSLCQYLNVFLKNSYRKPSLKRRSRMWEASRTMEWTIKGPEGKEG